MAYRLRGDRSRTFLVGRGSWSHLCLQDDLHFSRHHFRIEIRPPDCYLVDLGSRNGTFVDGNRVNATFLRDGDVISGGRSRNPRERHRLSRASLPTRPPCWGRSIDHYLREAIRDAAQWKVPSVREIPGYELQEEIGRGFDGRGIPHPSGDILAKPVAIKVISPRQSASEAAMQLFVPKPACWAGSITRTSCSVSISATAPDSCIWSWNTSRRSHTNGIEEQGSARTRVSCTIICQILQALDHAHEMSIVHRDIKPENVLLSRKGRKLNAKLADFGLAKNYAYAGLSEISRLGDIRGTIAYLAPELVIDCRQAQPGGDIYAVGQSLYRYLSNEFPFDFGDKNKLAVVLEDEPVPLRRRVPKVPSAVEEIVHRAGQGTGRAVYGASHAQGTRTVFSPQQEAALTHIGRDLARCIQRSGERCGPSLDHSCWSPDFGGGRSVLSLWTAPRPHRAARGLLRL